MCVKAELLYGAGIINAKELNAVIGRAAAIIDQSEVAGESLSALQPTGYSAFTNAWLPRP
jgi:hypothetical protein